MKNKNINMFKNNNIYFISSKFFVVCFYILSVVSGWVFLGIYGFVSSPKASAAVCTQPADIILVIDASGSMDTNSKIVTTKAAAKSFIDKLNLTTVLPNGDQVGLVSFSNFAELNNQLTQNGSIVKNNIDNLIAGGQTNLKDAIEKSTIELNYIRHNALARKVMVILSDGAPNRPYPEDTAVQMAINAATDAKNTYGIRIITIGLDLQSLTEAEKTAAIYALTSVASAPSDFFQTTSTETLDGIYTTISQALCDAVPPQIVSVSRNPSGTVYSADTIKINSTATDNIGIKSNLIKWTRDNWVTTNTSTASNCDANRNNCSLNIGPFVANENIKYKIEVTDSNDNVTVGATEFFNIASLSISSPSIFLRNTANIITVTINDPDGKMLLSGGAMFYISVESPDGSSIKKIDKSAMTCLGTEFSRTCNYTVNPDCSWIDSTAKIYIHPYDNNYDLRYHNPPETKSVTINNPIEAKTEAGRCNNCINDDCDAGNKWDLANYNNSSAGCGSTAIYDSGKAESACDSLAPIVAISRTPSGNVFETDSLMLASLATEIPPGLNIIQSHKIWYRVNSGGWVNAVNCLDTNSNGLCDFDESTNIANISFTLPAYAPGTIIDYYSEATDTTPSIPNTGRSSPTFDTVTIAYAECYNIDGSQKAALTSCTGGKCCGGVCNSVSSFNGNCTLDDECRQDTCSGTAWTCASANAGVNCSTSLGSTDGCFPYSTGCEERNYSCQIDGSCSYSTPSNVNVDGCTAGSLSDYGCSGSFCSAVASTDCSQSGTINGCACSCGGYGKEEKFYGALSVDGVDDYASVPMNVYSDNMSLEMWVKPRVVNSGSYQGFAGYQGMSSNYRPFNLWIGPSSGGLHWWISKSDNSASHSGTVFNFFTGADIWYHVVFVKEGSSLKIYKNGAVNILPDAPFSDIYKPSMFWIGRIDNNFNGTVDEVRIYNRALDAAEIMQHYKGEYPNNTGLTGLWHLDGNTNDSSGNLNNGVLNLGTAGNTNSSLAWISDRTDINNISPPWRLCSDVDGLGVPIDNNCNGLRNFVPGFAEASCDNILPIVYIVSNPAVVYDDIPIVTFTSIATDEFGISQHKIKWTKDDWATFSEQICPSSGTCVISTGGAFPAGTSIKYKSEAVDNNGNIGYSPDYFVRVLSRDCEGKMEGDSCSADLCVPWNFSGCEARKYTCISGICDIPFLDRKDDTCSSSILQDFACSGVFCAATGNVCSVSGSVNGCACSCDGYGKEEKYYKALSFDGVDDRLDIPNSPNLNMADGEFAVEFWIKSTKNGMWEAIGKNSAWFGFGKGWHFSAAGTPTDLLFEVSDGATRKSIPSNLGRVFDWKHIVGQRRLNTIELYVNGIKQPGSAYMPGDVNNIKPLNVGSYGGATNFFGGVISGIHIYNRSLSETEITQHFNGFYPNENVRLVGLWNLDGNTNDSSGNLNNGILNLGTAGNTNIVNAWLSNKSVLNNVPPPLQLICSDGKDNNCNGFIDSGELTCDTVFDSIIIGRTPSGTVYGSDSLILDSIATDSSPVSVHKVSWSIDNGPWNYSLASDCIKSPDEKTSTCSKNIGSFVAGTTIKYRAEATDANGNSAVTIDNEVVIRDECFSQTDGVSCASGSGICCGGFCDAVHWRKPIIITGSSAGSVMGYQVKMDIPYNSKIKADFRDVYFTDSDGVALLPFWLESFTSGVSATFWVKVPVIPISPGTKTVYMYYGSTVITPSSNGKNTFDIFEDWESGAVDISWIKGGSLAPYWTTDPVTKKEGNYSSSNNVISNNQSSWIRRSAVLPTGGKLSYYWRVDSERTYDFMYFCVNNDSCSKTLGYTNRISGNSTDGYYGNPSGYMGGWQVINYDLPAGTDSIKFAYEKDGSFSKGSDKGWVDSIRVRRYISPEPWVSIGIEESKGLTDYLLDSECSSATCSSGIPSVWTWVPANDGAFCSDGGNASGCYIWPETGNGCESRSYSCNNGACSFSSANQTADSCSGNVYNDYGCGNSCSGPTQSYDCSLTGFPASVYDDTSLSCNCKCGGYDVQERFYSSLNLDGLDDYINVPDSNSLDIINNISLSVWIRPDALSTYGHILSKRVGGIANYGFRLGDGGAGTSDELQFYYWDGSSWQLYQTSNANLITGSWQNVAVSYTFGTGNSVKVYKDGVLLTGGWIIGNGNTLVAANALPLTIGANGDPGEFFKGSIYEARVYNRVLSQAEILQQFNGEYFNNTGLVGSWRLDGNSNDSSGIIPANNGVLSLGTVGNVNAASAWASGRLDTNNVPLLWRVCSDMKNNDCDPFNKIDAAELVCDGMSPLISLEIRDNIGSVIANGASVYDTDIDQLSEKLSFSSLASDNFSIAEHKIMWTINNWVDTNVADCLTGNCSPYEVFGDTFSLMPKPITVKYYAKAADGNGNMSCFPAGCQASANYFTIVPYNTAPVVTPLSIVQSGDYCSPTGGPQLTVTWNYFDNEGNPQSAYQVEIADNPAFTDSIISMVFSSVSTSYSLSSGLSYGKTYYWKVKVWDSKGWVSAGSGGVCGDWKCDLGQSTTTPVHQYPSVNFDWLPLNPKVSEEVQFNNTSTPTTGVTWEWDLNSPGSNCGSPFYSVTAANRDNTTDWNPTYVYGEPVNFAVGLKVTDIDHPTYFCEIQKCLSLGKKPPRWKEVIPK